MEGMLQSGQEDYIWAMRNTAYQDSEEESWLEESHSFTGATPSTQLRKRSKARSLTTDPQSTVLASLVPDEVIYNVNDYSHRHYDACFLFGDVSGFTELADKYNRPGAAGPSRLTQVLNHYLGAMVQEIMSHQGDVLKFSGDAFLAMWKCTENTSMRDAVHQVLDCALLIQKTYGSYRTDVGVVIRVKLAISAGAVIFALIGDETSSHYVVVGKPIWDVKSAEALSVAGDVIVAPAAFHFTNPNEYLSQEMNDGMHVKVLGFGPNWRSTQKSVRHQHLLRADSEGSFDVNDDEHSSSNSVTTNLRLSEEFSLRPAVNAAIRHDIKQDLRKFIIKPVIKSVDMNEPFEYLTEMRQVAVMFINIKARSFEITATLALAHESYKIVCRVCEELKGCVNKVSFFDKDLMIVVIFGLRGLKQELESRMALKCAVECQQSIAELKQVLNVSIGVTTGKTYCGVFGHTLRREYTVISLTVNKAARIMCAYKGKVTCDRETFLHSKLEAEHFVLQEHKTLKGISNPGPIYEFRELPVDRTAQQRVTLFPLLGRDDELKLFMELLGEDVAPPSSEPQWKDSKMFLIRGDARQGKTRLLEECVYSVHSKIPVSRLTLTKKDVKVPYQAVKLMFALPLGLSSTDSSIQEREGRLMVALRQMKVPDLLCCLNHMFGVQFKLTDLYASLDDKTKKLVEHKMLKQLCAGCLLIPWIFTVDDVDYMDDETWELMDTLLEEKRIFFAATISRNNPQNPIATKLMADHRVKVVELKSIDRRFHGGLACQILDVYALPAELEKWMTLVIQARSNGNPGWIESYLISLIQADGLYIVNIDFKKIKELGLVCPPLYMMIRMTSVEDTMEWKQEMEERSSTLAQGSAHDFWKIYIDSCRGSHEDIVIREELERKFRRKPIQPVCMIKRDFNIADVDPEVSVDVMILKTFDSLSSYEQLIIKVSAILGNQFSRDMLMFVMASAQIREAALAIKTLFEIKVLSCAKGDFLESGNVVFKERLSNPNNDVQLKCLCRGVKIDEVCRDLPRYASCGYMQFRSSMFRDITYNLLTDNQKKEFHFRAIRYLEKETRKCRSCGNGFFDRILGIKREEHFLEKRKKKQREDNNSAYDDASISMSQRSSLHSSPSTSLSNKTLDATQSVSSGASSSALFDNKHSVFKSIWGFRYISKLKDSYSLTKAFSSEDFTDCQCSLILTTTYAQLMEHCKGAQNWPKLLDTMLEYSNVCINSDNVSLAMLVLEEALLLITDPSRSTSDIYWRRDMQRGKAYSLLGYCRMEMGHSRTALQCLNSSLAAFGFKFPANSCRKTLRTYRYEVKQLFGFFVLPGALVDSTLDHWQTLFSNYVSECLSFLCLFYITEEGWDDAELAATWSLSYALRAFSDFHVVCTAYSNMMLVAQHLAKSKLCLALEVHALQLCHMKKESVDADELKAVAKLYSVIFRNRFNRSDMRRGIQIAYIVLRIGSSLHAAKIVLPVIATMMRCLLLGKHVSGAVSMLHDIDYFAGEDTDRSARVWYYALAMTFHLETGYTVVRYQDCEKYYQLEGDYLVALRDPDALKRFHATMWLWCVRNDKWESADLWSHRAPGLFELKPNDSPANNFTALHVLEGMIVHLVCKMNRRNPRGIQKAKTKIKTLLATIESTAKRVVVLLPRLYHLQAYYRLVVHNDGRAFAIMQKGCKLAKSFENFFEISWMEHSKKAWSRKMSTLVRDFWRDHCEPDNVLDYHEIDGNGGKLGFYTLPIPMYL